MAVIKEHQRISDDIRIVYKNKNEELTKANSKLLKDNEQFKATYELNKTEIK